MSSIRNYRFVLLVHKRQGEGGEVRYENTPMISFTGSILWLACDVMNVFTQPFFSLCFFFACDCENSYSKHNSVCVCFSFVDCRQTICTVCVLWCICECKFVPTESVYYKHVIYVLVFSSAFGNCVWFSVIWLENGPEYCSRMCIKCFCICVHLCIPHREVGWDVEFAQRTGSSDEAAASGFRLQSSHCETETNKSPYHTGWDQCESDTHKHTI